MTSNLIYIVDCLHWRIDPPPLLRWKVLHILVHIDLPQGIHITIVLGYLAMAARVPRYIDRSILELATS